MDYKQKALIRFWQKVEKSATCWIWIGAQNSQGYGNYTFRRRDVGAHRFSYEEFNGPIPDGMYVMHSCDTPLCVNPEHLVLGTAKLNAIDREAKGRGRHRHRAKRITFDPKYFRHEYKSPEERAHEEAVGYEIFDVDDLL